MGIVEISSWISRQFELSQVFEGTAWGKYQSIIKAFKRGDIPANEIYQFALGRVVFARHLIGEVPLRSIPISEIHHAVEASPTITEAYQWGKNGINPPQDIFRRSFNYPNIESSHYPSYSVDFPPYQSDLQLPTSLPAHLCLFEKEKNGNNQTVKYEQALQAVKSADPGNVEAIINWLYLKELLSFIGRQKVFSLLYLAALDQHNAQCKFQNLEDFFHRLRPTAYYFGWEDRLKPVISNLELSLPDYLQEGYNRQVVLSAFFLRDQDQLQQLSRCIRELKSGKNPHDVVKELFQYKDKLRKWEIDSLSGIRHSDSLKELKNLHPKAKNETEARSMINGLSMLFWGSLRTLGYDPQAEGTINLTLLSADRQQVVISFINGVLSTRYQPLPEKITGNQVVDNQLRPIEFSRIAIYDILAPALLGLQPLNSDISWNIKSEI